MILHTANSVKTQYTIIPKDGLTLESLMVVKSVELGGVALKPDGMGYFIKLKKSLPGYQTYFASNGTPQVILLKKY